MKIKLENGLYQSCCHKEYLPGWLSVNAVVISSPIPTQDMIIKNGKFGPSDGTTDIHDELNNLIVGGATITAISESGYTYKVESSTPTPPPTPYHGGGSSGGSSGGSPIYDSSGNILGPGGIQNYNYDGSNPPNLAGKINVSSWDYASGTQQASNIQYVQNTDSFIRADNTPVATEWVGVTTDDIGKIMWYRTDAAGKILKNQYIQIGDSIYYLDSNGIMVTGTLTIDGVTHHFDTTTGGTEGRLLY